MPLTTTPTPAQQGQVAASGVSNDDDDDNMVTTVVVFVVTFIIVGFGTFTYLQRQEGDMRG